MKYKYEGITRNRQRVTGFLEGKNEQEVRARLFSMQVRPTAISPERVQGDFQKKFEKMFNSPSIDLKGLMIFTRQLSSLVNAGVPVVTALDILHKQERRKGFKKVLFEIKENIEGGGGFAESLEKYPSVFSEFYIRVVEAGELSGTLDKALIRVNLQLEKLSKLKKKVVGALTYPILTLVVAVVVVLFLLWKVVPEITKLYGTNKLPELTQIVLDISKFVQENIFLLLFGTIGFFVGIVSLYRVPKAKQVIDPLLLKVPAIGALILRSGVAGFSRTLATLVSSGVPLLQGFDICEKIVGNYAIKQVILDAKNAVTEGRTIGQGLEERKIFPSMVIHMVNTGEVTGRLDDMLLKVADIYDEEVDDAVGLVTSMLQPILIVGVGIVVTFILMAMYLPIFSLSEKMAG